MQEDVPILYKTQLGEWKFATCGECLHKHLGDRVDISWDMKTACMRIEKSSVTGQHEEMKYEKKENVQLLKNVHFMHSEQCPLLDQKMEKNPTKTMKPCSCVLLYKKEKKEFLATQRSGSISFPYAWVLPGGHLQKNQGIFQGGMRECEEQVGLPHSQQKNIPIQDRHIMIWESANDVEGKVRSGALVVFFMAQCQQFDVKVAEKEVSGYKWRKVQDQSEETLYDSALKQGYARGHRAFLNILRKQNPDL